MKKKLSFGLGIEPTLNRGKTFRVTFSVGRFIEATLATVRTEEHAKALVNEAKSVMSQRTGVPHIITKAMLSSWPLLNSERENIRLQAAQLLKTHS